jgi:molybdenum cofactor cytidylyltransferase
MVKTENISAVILAAGFSKRMGQFKPLMDLGSLTVVERVVALYRAVGLTDIGVVVGFRGGEVKAALSSAGVRITINKNFEKGMFTSIVEGVRVLPDSCRAFFVNPVDIPLVRVPTVKALLRVYQERAARIYYPWFNGRRGHPPLIDGGFSSEIINWTQDGGLRSFLHKREDLAMNVPVTDEGVLLDLDTPEDYRLLKARLREEAIPTSVECRMLMQDIQALPEDVINHCRAVAAMAKTLAAAVNRAGGNLDVKLVYAAALVHNIDGMEEPHPQSGDRVLEDWGFPHLAEIVRRHQNIQVHENDLINETEIVYLADALVSGNQPDDLEQGSQLKKIKCGQDSPMVDVIRLRWDNARKIKAKVEHVTGCPLQSILDPDILLKGDVP